MRFLCLHGMGTNGRIFELQTAAIRHALGDGHSYEWLEGSIETDMAPGMQDLVAPADEFLTYIDDTWETRNQVLADMERFIEAEGPFDGLLAFSLGAGCGATYLIHKIQQQQQPVPFRCAVFFCGAPPFLSQQPTGEIERTPRQIIGIPTAHIWGRRDSLWGYGPELSRWCRADICEVLVHEGGHEIPGARHPVAVRKCVQVIKRTLARACIGEA